jgi:hypothetical protein
MRPPAEATIRLELASSKKSAGRLSIQLRRPVASLFSETSMVVAFDRYVSDITFMLSSVTIAITVLAPGRSSVAAEKFEV